MGDKLLQNSNLSMGKTNFYRVRGAIGLFPYMKKRTKTVFFSLMPDTYPGTEWKWKLETWMLRGLLGCFVDITELGDHIYGSLLLSPGSTA